MNDTRVDLHTDFKGILCKDTFSLAYSWDSLQYMELIMSSKNPLPVAKTHYATMTSALPISTDFRPEYCTFSPLPPLHPRYYPYPRCRRKEFVPNHRIAAKISSPIYPTQIKNN